MTSLVLRVFDRDVSSHSETFLGQVRVVLDKKTLTMSNKKPDYGGKCISEQWFALQGSRSGGMSSEGTIKLTLDYFHSIENLSSQLDAAKAEGLAVPETPIFASTPGVHGLLRAKMEEDESVHDAWEEEENMDLEQPLSPTSGHVSQGVFARVASSERETARQLNLMHLDALLGYAEGEEQLHPQHAIDLESGSDPSEGYSRSTGQGGMSPLESVDTFALAMESVDTHSVLTSGSHRNADSRGDGSFSSARASQSLASSRISRPGSFSAVSTSSLSSTVSVREQSNVAGMRSADSVENEASTSGSSRMSASALEHTSTTIHSADSHVEQRGAARRRVRERGDSLTPRNHRGMRDHAGSDQQAYATSSDRGSIRSARDKIKKSRGQEAIAAVPGARVSSEGHGSGSRKASHDSPRAGSSHSTLTVSDALLPHEARTGELANLPHNLSRGEGSVRGADHHRLDRSGIEEFQQRARLPSAGSGEGGAGQHGGSDKQRKGLVNRSCLKSSLERPPSQAQIAVCCLPSFFLLQRVVFWSPAFLFFLSPHRPLHTCTPCNLTRACVCVYVW